MVYSGAWGKLIHEKNQKSKISWHCPFNAQCACVHRGGEQALSNKNFILHYPSKREPDAQFPAKITNMLTQNILCTDFWKMYFLSWGAHTSTPYVSYVVVPQGQMNFMADWNVVMFLGSPAIKVAKYWVIYRGPGFLAVVWFGSSPAPLPPALPSATASCLSFAVFLCVAGRAYWRERGAGEEPNRTDRE